MKTGHRKRILICVCLILLNLAFIFGNSLLPGNQSAKISDGILEVLVEFLDESIPNGRFLIRKTAHFMEFACLGLLVSWLFLLSGTCSFRRIAVPLFFGVMIALTDETLQFLAPERAPGVLDVWIDFLGYTSGVLLMYLGSCLRQKRKHSSNGGN